MKVKDTRFTPWIIAGAFLLIYCSAAFFLLFIKKDKPHYENIDGKKVHVITYWDWNVKRLKVLEKYIERYEKEKNHTIKIKTLFVAWNQYWSKLVAATVGGKPPTVANMHNFRHSQLVTLLEPFPKDLFPLEEMHRKYYLFNKAFVHKDSNGDDRFYYMPLGITTGLIYYNMDIWEAHGLTEADIPDTWDKFKQISKKLTAYEQNDKTIRVSGFNANGNNFNPNLSYLIADLLYQFDGKFYNNDHSRILFDSPEIYEATYFLLDLYDGVCDVRSIEMSQAFASYQSSLKDTSSYSAMIGCWSWFTNFINRERPDMRWGVFPMPMIDQDGFYGRANYECAQGILASVNPDDKKAGFEFLKWLHQQDDYLVELNREQGTLPGKMTLWDEPTIKADPTISSIRQVIDQCVFPGEVPAWMLDQFFSFEDLLRKGTPLSEALPIVNKLLNEKFNESPLWITE